MSFNQTVISQIRAQDGNTIKEVENFKYLGSWTQSSEKDIAVRKAVASQTQEDLDIQTTQNDESEAFPCNCRICTALWIRDVDRMQTARVLRR
eukprot:gene5262-5926_t